ncbi:MAG: signal peptidase I [Deltaproteobacteria bacterium]|nr:signal peptidase I [Deltaproteobacteria bacterium]
MKKFLKILFKIVIWVGGFVLIVGGVMRFFFVDEVIVGHNGMAPTMITGEKVLLWRGATPDMGDIVVCRHPGQPNVFVMGRVMALGGMHLSAPRGQLTIEGSTPDRDIEGYPRFHDVDHDVTTEMTYGIEKLGNTDFTFFEPRHYSFRLREHRVPDDKIYLLGDNRGYIGQDSRYFGDVDPGTCRGTIFMRLQPVDDEGAELGHGWLDILD